MSIQKQNGEMVNLLSGSFYRVGKRITPTANTGVNSYEYGLFFGNATQESVDVSGELNLFYMSAKNTEGTQGGSQLYMIKLVFDTDKVDVGAGIAVFNVGKSDGIYICLSGKAGAGPYSDNAPTGIGIDVNKETDSSDENSSDSSQQGIQIFDWSTTDQGAGGPRLLLLQKQGDLNTAHVCQTIKSNKNALQIVYDSGDAGYVANSTLLYVADEASGGIVWQVLSGGSQLMAQDTAIEWATGGTNNAIISGTSADLKLRSGSSSGGVRINNNADTSTIVMFGDSGYMSLGSLSTLSFTILDAGTASATEAGWVYVRIGASNLGYLRMYATK